MHRPVGRWNSRVLDWLEDVYKWDIIWLDWSASKFGGAGDTVRLQCQHGSFFFAGEVRVFHSLNTFTSVYDRENDCSNKSMFSKNLLCRPSVRRPSEKVKIACCAALWCHLLLRCAKISNEWLVCNNVRSRLGLLVVKLSRSSVLPAHFLGLTTLTCPAADLLGIGADRGRNGLSQFFRTHDKTFKYWNLLD